MAYALMRVVLEQILVMPSLPVSCHASHNSLNFQIQLKLHVGLHILLLLRERDIECGLGVGEGVELLEMVKG